MLLLYIGGAAVLKESIFEPIFISLYEKELHDFKDYVEKNHIAATDTEALKSWAEDNSIKRLIVERDDALLVDTAYWGVLNFGAVEVYDTDTSFHPLVEFADGEAFVSMSQEYEFIYNVAALAVSISLGVAVCLWIFAGGMRENIRYIQKLEKEVEVIASGDLDEGKMLEIVDGLKVKKNANGVSLKLPTAICSKYFEGMNAEQMASLVEQALDAWFAGKETADVQ